MACAMCSHERILLATLLLASLRHSRRRHSELSPLTESGIKIYLLTVYPQRRRVTFPKALASFFHTCPNPTSTAVGQNDSTPSSTRSRAHSDSFSGSTPSVEFVSSGAFMFSGPSLNAGSVCHSSSTSRLPSLREGSSEVSSLRRVYSDTFSFYGILVSRFRRRLSPIRQDSGGSGGSKLSA